MTFLCAFFSLLFFLALSALAPSHNPIEAFADPVSCQRAARLDLPVVRFDTMERERFGDLRRGHGALEILLVGKYAQRSVP